MLRLIAFLLGMRLIGLVNLHSLTHSWIQQVSRRAVSRRPSAMLLLVIHLIFFPEAQACWLCITQKAHLSVTRGTLDMAWFIWELFLGLSLRQVYSLPNQGKPTVRLDIILGEVSMKLDCPIGCLKNWGISSELNSNDWDFPDGLEAKTSCSSMKVTWVWSLFGELVPICCN